MNGVRTRRQAAKDTYSEDEDKPVSGNINGHALSPHDAKLRKDPEENIFLFYPNLIGMLSKAIRQDPTCV